MIYVIEKDNEPYVLCMRSMQSTHLKKSTFTVLSVPPFIFGRDKKEGSMLCMEELQYFLSLQKKEQLKKHYGPTEVRNVILHLYLPATKEKGPNNWYKLKEKLWNKFNMVSLVLVE